MLLFQQMECSICSFENKLLIFLKQLLLKLLNILNITLHNELQHTARICCYAIFSRYQQRVSY